MGDQLIVGLVIVGVIINAVIASKITNGVSRAWARFLGANIQVYSRQRRFAVIWMVTMFLFAGEALVLGVIINIFSGVGDVFKEIVDKVGSEKIYKVVEQTVDDKKTNVDTNTNAGNGKENQIIPVNSKDTQGNRDQQENGYEVLCTCINCFEDNASVLIKDNLIEFKCDKCGEVIEWKVGKNIALINSQVVDVMLGKYVQSVGFGGRGDGQCLKCGMGPVFNIIQTDETVIEGCMDCGIIENNTHSLEEYTEMDVEYIQLFYVEEGAGFRDYIFGYGDTPYLLRHWYNSGKQEPNFESGPIRVVDTGEMEEVMIYNSLYMVTVCEQP